MTANPHLRAILIASALALTAVALGLYTLSQANKGGTTDEALPPAASLASPHKTLPEPKPGSTTKATQAVPAKPKPKAKPVPNPFVVAAKAGGLPKAVAAQLGGNEVVVVALGNPGLKIDTLTTAEAKAGASAAHAGFVAVDVSGQGTALALTRSLGVLDAPGVLVYRRPAELFMRFDGYSDSKTIAQAAQNADPTPGGVDRSAWARDANTICSEGAKKIAAVGTPTTPGQRLVFAPQVQTIEKDTRAKLHGLTAPAGAGKKVAAMLGAYDAMTPLEAQRLDAMRKGDKPTASKLEARSSALGAKGDRIALSLGASSCQSA